MRTRSGVFIAAMLLGLLLATPAGASVGVERTSRTSGVPGAEVRLTVACGFCYPPCRGPRGDRQPKPCMLGTELAPPESFAISLAPVDTAPWAPQAAAPPSRAPFRYLGEAVLPKPLPETGRIPVPRYVLDFKIPDLRPGDYAYVIYCDVCKRGRGGSLIGGGLDADHLPRPWRLEVRAPRGGATTG